MEEFAGGGKWKFGMSDSGRGSWWQDVLEEKIATCEQHPMHCAKDQVYVLPVGTRTYTWLVKSGVFYTTLEVENLEGELANTVWHAGDIIHSLDVDIVVPAHAMVDGELVRVLSSEFNGKLEGDARASMALAEYYHRQFTQTLFHYRFAALVPSKERLAYFEDYFGSMPDLEGAKVDDKTMALFLGMHRASVSRLRHEAGKGGGKAPGRKRGKSQ